MKTQLLIALACALALAAGPGATSAQGTPPGTTTVVVEVTVWRSVANPAILYVSTRPEGGRWNTENTALDLSALSRSGSFHQSNAVGVEVPLGGGESATVEVTVWRSVANPAILYVSTRPEGGRWSTENTALDLSTLSRSGNFHQSNAVGVEVRLQRAATDTTDTDRAGYIPSLNATVISLDLFERGAAPVPRAERVYRTTFDRATSRFISWQLQLHHPPPDTRIDFSIDTTISRSDGTVLASHTSTASIDEGWTNSYRTSGQGWATAGFWQPGTYRTELAVAGKTVAAGDFEVVDRRLPASGSFAALRETLPWARGSLNHDSHVALLALARLQQSDPALAASVASLPWLREAPDGNELRALQQVDILARADIEVARRVATYPWLADGVSDDEWLDLQTLGRTRARSASAGRLVAGADWMRDGLDEDERSTLTNLRKLAERTPLAGQVAAFPWMRDDITEHERWIVSNLVSLAGAGLPLASSVIDFPWFQDNVTEHERRAVWNLQALAEWDLQLARLVADLPWFQDDVTEHERWTVWNLEALAEGDLRLARLVAGLPWLQDAVTTDERWTVRHLNDLASVEPQLAGLVAGLPWFQDDITEHERWIASNLVSLAGAGPQLARSVIDFPWFQDEVTERERKVVWSLAALAEPDLQLANLVAGLPWLEDGVTEHERRIVWNLAVLAEADLQLANLVADLSWFQDGVTEHERWTVWHLAALAEADLQLGNFVAGLPWLQDDITTDERWAVRNLAALAEAGVDIVATMPFLQDLPPAGAAATRALAILAREAPEALASVLEHPAVEDGITEDETVVVSTLWGVYRTNPDLIETLLDPAETMREDRTVELPGSGEVQLTIIRTKAGPARTMDLIEEATAALEELMDEPLPSRQVTFLFEDAVTTRFFGTHFGTHIALKPEVDSLSFPRTRAFIPIIHEVAHYYWRGNLPWVDEGVANLLETVVSDTLKDLPERDAVFPCPYARRIIDLEAIGPNQTSQQFLCSYSLGERLFRDLYRKLGEDFWAGLQRLYQKSQAEDESDGCEGTSLGACHVEAAFKEGGSQDVIAIVDEVFDFWYEKREPPVDDASP